MTNSSTSADFGQIPHVNVENAFLPLGPTPKKTIAALRDAIDEIRQTKSPRIGHVAIEFILKEKKRMAARNRLSQFRLRRPLEFEGQVMMKISLVINGSRACTRNNATMDGTTTWHIPNGDLLLGNNILPLSVQKLRVMLSSYFKNRLIQMNQSELSRFGNVLSGKRDLYTAPVAAQVLPATGKSCVEITNTISCNTTGLSHSYSVNLLQNK
ncbi:hypothetical protein OUZ56_010100 [Daphnia magna]|uniref:GMP synthase n=1 Tax=Daphnia magna TaxID=35525 RepID=A0ABR0AHS4_9CRUS|nr:hypothetical protein OUZ56_010100 [Daphnia magna]